MGTTKKRKKPTVENEREMRAFNPTKSRVGRIIILILAIGMFLAMLIAAIVGAVDVLS